MHHAVVITGRKWDSLAKFEAFADCSLAELKARIEPVCTAETTAQNTVQELQAAGSIFAAARIDRVILVSSPTHLPRCLRDACSLWSAPPTSSTTSTSKRSSWRPAVVLCSPSDTSYEGCSASDVTVLEPAHRGDRDAALDGDAVPQLHALAARALRVQRKDKLAFQQQLDALLREYET
jgi:DUF218 domain